MTEDQERDDFGAIIGIAKAVTDTPPIKIPETENDWREIATRIDAGEIDQTIIAAMSIKTKPDKIITAQRRSIFMKSYRQFVLKLVKDAESRSDFANKSPEEINEIWAQMLANIQQQRKDEIEP